MVTDGIRTRYLDLGKVAFCQMNYSRELVPVFRIERKSSDFQSDASTEYATQAYNGGPGGCRAHYLRRERIYSPPRLPIRYRPMITPGGLEPHISTLRG